MRYARWSCRSRCSASSETSIVPCTVPLSGKWNWRSVCMTPHYIPQRMRRKKQNEKRSSRHLHTKCHTSVSVVLSHRQRVRVCFPSVLHSAFWLVWGCVFRLQHQLACQARDGCRSACAPLLFIHLFICVPYPPPSHFFWFSPPSLFLTILLIFASFVPPSSFSSLSACPLSLTLCLSIFSSPGLTGWWIRVQVTVWHVSQLDVVNMLPADSAVEIAHSGRAQRHGYILAQLPSIALLLVSV